MTNEHPLVKLAADLRADTNKRAYPGPTHEADPQQIWEELHEDIIDRIQVVIDALGDWQCDKPDKCKRWTDMALKYFPKKRDTCSVHGGKFTKQDTKIEGPNHE